MRARFHDGRTARAHEVEAAVSRDGLRFAFEGEAHHWPLADVEAERVGERVRLSRRRDPARLTVDAAEWRAATASAGEGIERHGRRREWRLIGGLVAGAAFVAFVVFVGVPLASGPLARATPVGFERQMGNNFESQLAVAFPRCTGRDGQDALYVFGDSLEDGAATPFNLRVQAVEAPMVNAFALPGGAIMVTDDLIDMAETPDELAAVIAHEAAHVEQRHVMQAVWRSLGLGLILDAVVGGGTGAGQQAVLLAGSFTDLRYSRDAEQEADARGQAILSKIGLSSQGMAPFFRRLAGKGEGKEAQMVKELISSHPDTQRRAKLSQARAKPGRAAFSAEDWKAIKQVCAKDPRRRFVPKVLQKR
jgi:beta-barrel assembly-enhancing protease